MICTPPSLCLGSSILGFLGAPAFLTRKNLVVQTQICKRSRNIAPIEGCGEKNNDDQLSVAGDAPRSPRVSIDYCTGCRWGLRAAWMAQELLTTFESDLAEVALRPSSKGGTFDVWVDGHLIWCRHQHEGGGFPELKDMKRKIRNLIVPTKSLGHSDR